MSHTNLLVVDDVPSKARASRKADRDSMLDHGRQEEQSNERHFVAASPAVLKLCQQIRQVARVDVPVMPIGASASETEAIARRIHTLSSRTYWGFSKVNCAGPGLYETRWRKDRLAPDVRAEQVFERELLGCEARAFPGSTESKRGQLELCHKETILFDEITEMPPRLQVRLLSVLDEQRFCRLGGCSVVKVDVPILAATRSNLQHSVVSGKLREDLYPRLNVVALHVPPLAGGCSNASGAAAFSPS